MPVLWPDYTSAMSFAHDHSSRFWGALVNPDKSPSHQLEQLCLGIAQVIISFDNSPTTDLTPERLAAFYRKVGGNYDVLFLDTKHSALSFIYQRLGCFHSIQPSTDPYKPPSIPALQPHGFVRWQTIQLLLDPDEHVRYFQRAVEKWNIPGPNGTTFPKAIPRNAFPLEPDSDMMQWHQNVSQQFEIDYWNKNVPRSSPPDFGTYHNQFSQKKAAPCKDDDFVSQHHHHHDGAPVRRHLIPSNLTAAERHRRRQSAEFPSSATRKQQPTLPRRSAEFVAGFASPRAPSPPTSWPRQASANSRGRERISYSRPASPDPALDSSSSDTSSEDSSNSTIPEEPFPPASNRYGTQYRHLSPPHSPHTRRHSHEAYSRKPQREKSPDTQRRFAYREAYNNPSTTNNRPYDSDSGRRIRQSRLYTDDVRQSRTPAPGPSGFREPATVPTSPVYAHVQPRFVNVNNKTFMVHPRPEPDDDYESRRTSYRPSNVKPNPNGGIAAPTPATPASPPPSGRARFSSMSDFRPPRWSSIHNIPNGRGIPQPGVIDTEYSNRRASMYER